MHTKPGTYTGGEGPKCFNSYFHFLLQLVFVYYVDMVQIVDMLREYLTCAGRGGGGGGGGSSDGYQDMDELEKLAGKLSLSETSKQVCAVMHRYILQLLALLLTHPLLLLPPPLLILLLLPLLLLLLHLLFLSFYFLLLFLLLFRIARLMRFKHCYIVSQRCLFTEHHHMHVSVQLINYLNN